MTADPADHPKIEPEELALIQADAPRGDASQSPSLAAFLRSSAVWAVVVAHFCNNWALYVLLSWMPTYVNQGLGVDFAAVGWFTMIPALASFVFLNVAGSAADRMIRNGTPVLRVRKLMQLVGFGGITGTLAVVGYVQEVWAAIGLMCAGNALGAFVTGGYGVNHMDIAPKYAGTMMGITNTAATIPGVIGVFVSGLILEATGSWTLVFQTAAGFTLFGLVFFLVFARADRQFD